jgi:hypothetical protein
LASSTPPLLQQWLEGLQHHQPRLRHNKCLRGFSIIATRGAPASSTPPPLQQRLEGLRHHQPHLRHNNDSRGSGIIDRLCCSNGSRSFGIIDLRLRYNNGSRSTAATFDITDFASVMHSAQSKSLSTMCETSLISTSQKGLELGDQSSQEDKSLPGTHERRLEYVSWTFGHSSCS